MNISQIENNLLALVETLNPESFIYDFLLAYGSPKSTIARLQKGGLNLSKNEGEIALKKKFFFKISQGEDVHALISAVIAEPKNLKHDPRFIIITDFTTLLAVDTKTHDSLDIPISDLAKHADFFLPLAGMEKFQHQSENPADVKAATKMAKLFDEIKKDNPDDSPEYIHGLNVFLSRLLFCFFAEDTNIFHKNQFTHAISSHTQADGSDLNTYLDTLFSVLNMPPAERAMSAVGSVSAVELPAYLQAFPYVNGSLFRQQMFTPVFSRHSRQAMIDSGGLDWKDINPDIFGSMFQAVISVDQRGTLGQHYTSVPNIMKVIEPLFLNELNEAFEQADGDVKKLRQLLNRISKIKIFDPACGSGNFLIIAYKELRKLEMRIIKELKELSYSTISLNNFYGIEIDDFAFEVAKLALWLAEHQMNVEFLKEIGCTNPTLPLSDAGQIVQGNACRVDWETVCPKNEGDEIYILGNPPYLGARMQEKEQKEDINFIFKKYTTDKKMDYIACWFIKASEYIAGINAQYSFVSTNSITQGEQVNLIWPHIFNKNLEISFAYLSFKWNNNAKSNAGVICVIIGVGNKNCKAIKTIYNGNLAQVVKNINGYLTSADNIFIERKGKPISMLPEMVYGELLNDGGHLILSPSEKQELVSLYPETSLFLKKIIGAKEFLHYEERWCIYITDSQIIQAYEIPPIYERLENVKIHRINSTEMSTRKLADTPHKFYFSAYRNTPSIIIPTVSSERRQYIPIGHLSPDNLIIAPNQAVYNAETWIFSTITSRMHMTWVRAVAGRLKTDYRYSSNLCYNTFPFPSISEVQKQELEKHVFRILEEREQHSEKTLAQLYDPDKMPEGLREAHRQNDLAVERCYRSRPFESDEERLEYLFKLYEQMIEEEKNKGSLFAEEKKTRKKK